MTPIGGLALSWSFVGLVMLGVALVLGENVPLVAAGAIAVGSILTALAAIERAIKNLALGAEDRYAHREERRDPHASRHDG